MNSDLPNELTRILEAVKRVGAAVAGEPLVARMAQTILDEAQQTIGAEIAVFCRLLRDPATSISESALSSVELLAESVDEETGEECAKPAFGAATRLLPILHQYLRAQGSTRIHDLPGQAEMSIPEGRSIPGGRVRSYLQVPLASSTGQILGVLCFGDSSAGRFSKSNLLFIECLAPWLASALERGDAVQHGAPSARASNAWIAKVAHELRNPLQRICMATELLPDIDEGPQRELVLKLRRATDSMEGLITNLVDMVATKSGELPMEASSGNVANVVEPSCEAQRVRDGKQVK